MLGLVEFAEIQLGSCKIFQWLVDVLGRSV